MQPVDRGLRHHDYIDDFNIPTDKRPADIVHDILHYFDIRHHHGDDQSTLIHNHDQTDASIVLDYHDNEYHWPNHYHHYWTTTNDILYDFGPADHDHG